MPTPTTERSLLVCVLTPPGVDPAPSVAALAAAGVAAPQVLPLEHPGAWAAARNAALAAAENVALLGLVDADVRVGPSWLDGVCAIDPAMGAIGGPVTAAGRAPGGVDAARHAQVLGLTDGDRPVPGNVVLDTAALRAIGGFAPTAGHGASVDGLADWQLALEALRAAGWGVGIDGRLVATRDLAPLTAATLLRRRLHTGARSAALNPDHRAAHPMIGAGRSVAAAGGRLVRGDVAGSVDRLAWAAGQTGTALGSWLAHGELQPDRTRTTWRPTVAAPQPSPLRARFGTRRRAPRASALVLLYHRVCELPDDPHAVAVTPQHFTEQMELLARRYRPAPLADVVADTAGPHAVAVTFDDGYVDNLQHALSVLERTGVPATLFASTGHIATGRGYWWDALQRAVAAALADGARGPLTLDLPAGPRTWRPTAASPPAPLLGQLHAALRPLSAAGVEDALAVIQQWAGVDAAPPDRDRPMTVQELRTLASAGPFDVQAHGRNHLSMAFMDSGTRLSEMRGSADDLEAWLGTRPTQFAYPFGVPGVDVDAASREDARAAGFRLAVINAPHHDDADPFAVPRLAIPDLSGPAFGDLLAARAR